MNYAIDVYEFDTHDNWRSWRDIRTRLRVFSEAGRVFYTVNCCCCSMRLKSYRNDKQRRTNKKKDIVQIQIVFHQDDVKSRERIGHCRTRLVDNRRCCYDDWTRLRNLKYCGQIAAGYLKLFGTRVGTCKRRIIFRPVSCYRLLFV